jgi:hypothetical protein
MSPSSPPDWSHQCIQQEKRKRSSNVQHKTFTCLKETKEAAINETVILPVVIRDMQHKVN